MSADPQRTRARIERAVFDADYGHSDPFATTIQEQCMVAAREALQMVKEHLALEHKKRTVDYHAAWESSTDEHKADSDYEEGAMDAAGNALAIIEKLLADLASDEAGKET